MLEGVEHYRPWPSLMDGPVSCIAFFLLASMGLVVAFAGVTLFRRSALYVPRTPCSAGSNSLTTSARNSRRVSSTIRSRKRAGSGAFISI